MQLKNVKNSRSNRNVQHLTIPGHTARISSLVGKRGLVAIKLEAENNDKIEAVSSLPRTVIRELHVKPPLLVQRALYPDSSFPHMAYVWLMSSAGSILENDRFMISIDAGPSTCSRITTQAASKVHPMNRGYAYQCTNISLAKGSYLEYVPEQIIPFRSSKYHQEVNIHANDDTLGIYTETFSAGRIASNEIYEFDNCTLKTRIFDNEGGLIITDNIRLEPGKKKDEFMYIFGNKLVWFTAYMMINGRDDPHLGVKISQILGSCEKQLSGFSAMPNMRGYVVRILADSADEINAVKRSLIELIRNAYSLKSNPVRSKY